jgi:CheY-like chemotaxis protein
VSLSAKGQDTKPRILIFDDDPAIRSVLSAACDRRGYEVLAFPDPGLCPLRATSRCLCEPPTICADIIISDLDMPSEKGLDFLEALLGKGCRCRHIALVSGSWSARDIARARSLGCQLFAKPFQISHITEWLDHVEREVSPSRRLHDWRSLGSTAEQKPDGIGPQPTP